MVPPPNDQQQGQQASAVDMKYSHYITIPSIASFVFIKSLCLIFQKPLLWLSPAMGYGCMVTYIYVNVY